MRVIAIMMMVRVFILMLSRVQECIQERSVSISVLFHEGESEPLMVRSARSRPYDLVARVFKSLRASHEGPCSKSRPCVMADPVFRTTLQQ